MRTTRRTSEPRPYHPHDKQNMSKRRKMERRAKHRDTTNPFEAHSLFDRGYAPPVGGACYLRWAWLFRP